MAAIDEFYLARVDHQAVAASMERSGPLSDAAKAVINAAAWKWFVANHSKRIFKKRILFWVIDLDVGDLEQVFVALFGPRPVMV